jgi:hypothetical protein
MENKQRERFWEKVNITYPHLCWEWKAGKRGDGYGHFSYQYKTWAAHRLSFYITYNHQPPVVRHKCDNPVCVNPLHLEAGTQKQNCQDTVERGRHNNASKTHCKNGHEYTKENTYLRNNGSRECFTCRKENKRRYDLRQENSMDL